LRIPAKIGAQKMLREYWKLHLPDRDALVNPPRCKLKNQAAILQSSENRCLAVFLTLIDQ
jgi:hypothetical protein